MFAQMHLQVVRPDLTVRQLSFLSLLVLFCLKFGAPPITLSLTNFSFQELSLGKIKSQKHP